MHVNVRSMGVGRVRVCMLCVGNSEQCERGVVAIVNATILSETLTRFTPLRVLFFSVAFFGKESNLQDLLGDG